MNIEHQRNQEHETFEQRLIIREIMYKGIIKLILWNIYNKLRTARYESDVGSFFNS
jgi:hypothetical protein